jgi:hypothetical protein
MRGLRRSTQRARNKGKIAQGAAIQMNHFLLNVEMSEWRSSTEQGIRTMQRRFAARSPARPSHQHQRCSCPHSPRGRLRYADRLRRPAGATANLKLTFHLDHSAGADHNQQNKNRDEDGKECRRQG